MADKHNMLSGAGGLTCTHVVPRGQGGDFFILTLSNSFLQNWLVGTKLIFTGLRLCLFGRTAYLVRANLVTFQSESMPDGE
jgi:hypothetical protein